MAEAPDPIAMASDPNTPRASLADLAYDHPELRVAIALNPATYQGLLDWLAELGDPDVNAALDARARGLVDDPDPGVLRLNEAPPKGIGEGSEPLVVSVTDAAPAAASGASTTVEPKPSRRPAFQTPRFAIVIGSLLVVLIAGIIIAATIHNGVLVAQEAAQLKAQQAAAKKANASAKPAHHHHSASATPTSTPVPTPTVTAPPLPPSIVQVGFSQTWVQGFVAAGGYTERVTVSVGTPEIVGSAYPLPITGGASFKGGKTCGADKTTDAVVPISVTATSTTSSFSQVVGANVQFESGGSYLSGGIEYEAYYTSGAQCNDDSSGELTGGFVSTNPVKDGASSSLPMFLIIQNFYTPDDPNGDQSLFDGIELSVSGSSGWSADGNPVTYQSVDSTSTTLPSGSQLQLGE